MRPYLLNTSYTITADITVPDGGAEGMIATSGGRFAGWGFYLLEGKPVFCWNLLDLERIQVGRSRHALSARARHVLEFDFKYDGLGARHNRVQQLLRGGQRRRTGTLKVDGKVVADEKKMEKTIPIILQWDESLRHRLRHDHRSERRRTTNRRSRSPPSSTS